MALALSGVEAGTSYGTPAVRVKKKFLARLREDDVVVLTPVDDAEQRFLMETQPETYFTTDHYRGYPTILVRLSKAHPDELRDMLERCWRALAPAKDIAAYDADR
jgi:hypothetical protein